MHSSTSLLLMFVLICAATPCLAVTRTFDGGPTGTSGDWGLAVNWSGDTLPGAGDEALFNGTASVSTITFVTGTIQRIVVANPSGAQNLVFTLSGNLTLTGAAGTSIFVDTGESALFQGSGGTRTIQCNDDVQAQGSGSSISFLSSITVLFQTGTPEFVVNSGASLTLNGLLTINIASQLNINNSSGSTAVVLTHVNLGAFFQPDDVGGTPTLTINGNITATAAAAGWDDGLISQMSIALNSTTINRGGFSSVEIDFGACNVTANGTVSLQNSVAGGSWLSNPDFGGLTVAAGATFSVGNGLGPTDYLGNTTFNGTVNFNSTAANFYSNLTIGSGATLNWGTVPGPVTFLGAGTITGNFAFPAQVAVSAGVRLVSLGSTVTVTGTLLVTAGAFGAVENGATAGGRATITYNGNVRIDPVNGWRPGEGTHNFAGNIDLGNTSNLGGVTQIPNTLNNEAPIINLVGGNMLLSFYSNAGSAFWVNSMAAATRVTQNGICQIVRTMNLMGATGTPPFYAWTGGGHVEFRATSQSVLPLTMGEGGFFSNFVEIRQASGTLATSVFVTRVTGTNSEFYCDLLMIEGDTVDDQVGSPDANAGSILFSGVEIYLGSVEVRDGQTATVDGNGGALTISECIGTIDDVLVGQPNTLATGMDAAADLTIYGSSLGLGSNGILTYDLVDFGIDGSTLVALSPSSISLNLATGVVVLTDSTFDGNGSAGFSITLGGALVAVRGCTFDDCDAAGLQFATGTNLAELENCTFTNGVSGGAHITFNGLSNATRHNADGNQFDASVGVTAGGGGGLAVDIAGGLNRVTFRCGPGDDFGLAAFALSASQAEADADNDATGGTDVQWDDNPPRLVVAGLASPANISRDTTPYQTVQLFTLSAVGADCELSLLVFQVIPNSGTLQTSDFATLTLFEDLNQDGFYDAGEEWGTAPNDTLDLPFTAGSWTIGVASTSTLTQRNILNGTTRRMGWAITFGASVSAATGTFDADMPADAVESTNDAYIVGLPLTVTKTLVAPATQLVITTQPGGANSGAPLAPQPVIELRNGAGQRVESVQVTVTAAISGPGTLGGALSVQTVNGVVSFTNLNVTTPADIVTQLNFSAAGVTAATSNAFTVTEGGGGSGGGAGGEDGGCSTGEGNGGWWLVLCAACFALVLWRRRPVRE
jgi:hypothetical protein